MKLIPLTCTCLKAVTVDFSAKRFPFRYQYQILQRNPHVTDNNKQTIVETFRSIAEILIWGDQNDSRVFE